VLHRWTNARRRRLRTGASLTREATLRLSSSSDSASRASGSGMARSDHGRFGRWSWLQAVPPADDSASAIHRGWPMACGGVAVAWRVPAFSEGNVGSGRCRSVPIRRRGPAALPTKHRSDSNPIRLGPINACR
jgi:hypothetical protein